MNWPNWEANEMIKEAEVHWEEPTVEACDRDVEEELAAQSEWQIYRWITGCSKHLWSSWEAL